MWERRCLDCNQTGLSPVTATNHRNRGHRVWWFNTETGELLERKPGAGNRWLHRDDKDDSDGNGHNGDLPEESATVVKPSVKAPPVRVRTSSVVKDSTTVTPDELSNIVFNKKSVEVVLPQIVLNTKLACEKLFGWPVMNISDFLATFCYVMMKKKGIVVNPPYAVIEKESEHG